MALEEVTFTNTNGEEISLSNIVNQVINFYGLKREVGETVLTDFNEGSEIRNLIEAFAIAEYARFEEEHEATRITFIDSSYGLWLDKIGSMPFINLERIAGEYATGLVNFNLATPLGNDISIPEGTIVSCSESNLDFTTTSECIIVAGELSGECSVEALSMGYDGNVPAGSIDTIVDDTINTELVSVNNPNALEMGADDEDDEDYRDRLLENVQSDGFGSLGWYVNNCEALDDVHDVLIVDTTETTNRGVKYTNKVLVNGTVKPTPDSALLDVLTVLTDTSNKILNHNFIVDRPEYTSVNLDIDLDVATLIPEDSLKDNLLKLFDGGASVAIAEYDGLKINESINREDIVSNLLIFEDVVNVTSITSDGFTEISELTPVENGVLKLNDINITQSEVS